MQRIQYGIYKFQPELKHNAYKHYDCGYIERFRGDIAGAYAEHGVEIYIMYGKRKCNRKQQDDCAY